MQKFKNSFHKIESLDEDIVKAVIDALDDSDLKEDLIKAYKRELDCFPHSVVIELNIANVVPARSIKAIVSFQDHRVNFLDGSWEALEKIINVHDFLLNKDTIEEYVRFYFYVVGGQSDKVVLIESLDDFPWSNAPPPSLMHMISDTLKPVNYISDGDGGMVVTGCFLYKQAFIKAQLLITKHGHITMKAQETVIETMDVLSSDIDA